MDPLDVLPQKRVPTFKASEFKQVELSKGTVLFRFCSSRGNIFSDCWTDKATVVSIFRTYVALNHKVQQSKVSVTARNTANLAVMKKLAVAHDWTKIGYMITAEVAQPFTAYVGPTEWQHLIDKDHKLSEGILEGGGTQYVLPRIKNLAIEGKTQEINRYLHVHEFRDFEETSWYKRIVEAGYYL